MQIESFYEAVGIAPLPYGREIAWHRAPTPDYGGVSIIIAHREGDRDPELAVEATLREQEAFGTATFTAAYMVARIRKDGSLQVVEMDGDAVKPEDIAGIVRGLIEGHPDMAGIESDIAG